MDHCYATAIDAFSFNNNCIALTISPDTSVGEPAKVGMEPDTTYVAVLNGIATAGPGSIAQVEAHYSPGAKTIVLSGTVPVGQKDYIKYVAVRNPAEFGAYVFKEILLSRNIELASKIYCTGGGCSRIREPGSSPDGPQLLPLTVLAVYRSPKLVDIIKVVNKISNNLYAENLFLTIAKANQKAGNPGEAARAVGEILKNAGLHPEGLYMVDGSGLSRLGLITPGETVDLLNMMARNPYFEAFSSSLAVPATEGTLKNWPTGKSAAAGNVRAKTGTMTNVRNLSGYVTTKDGELLAFSFLCNNYSMPRADLDALYAKILARLAVFSRR